MALSADTASQIEDLMAEFRAGDALSATDAQARDAAIIAVAD
tara:strand:+ start:60 stop:185 length:126 start_codon:yes stop_codon:yes gene_type:complete